MKVIKANRECSDCPLGDTAQCVCLMGRGPLDADMMIVGEAPGFREDETGKPFQGKAGELLNTLLQKSGLSRSEIYITNAVKCRPPENKTPTKTEVKACKKYLDKEIARVKPKFVMLLGATAMLAVFNKAGVTKNQGRVIEKEGINYLITLHPSYLFRMPQLIPSVEADFIRFKKLVEGTLEDEDILNWTLVTSTDLLADCYRDLAAAEVISYDLETSSLHPEDPESMIYCIGLATDDHEWVIPLDYPGSPFFTPQTQRAVFKGLKTVMRGKRLVAHNGKFDNKWFRSKFGWAPYQTFDTMLASYLLDENSPNGLKPLSKLYFHAPDYEVKQPVNPLEVPMGILTKYCAYDVHYTLRLYHLFREQLSQDPALSRIFKHLLMPTSRAFEEIELGGVYLDTQQYTDALKTSEQQIAAIHDKLMLAATEEGMETINWNATAQVATFLFDKKGLPVVAFTDGGKPSTSESVLLQLRSQDSSGVVEDLLEYRRLIKLNQFLNNWSENMGTDGRIHPNFLLHGTVTGRLSCRNPNLQQVPRDTFLRSIISAPPGWSLIEADYSQVELRIAAMVSGDVTMQRAYQTGQDLHRLTASTVMSVPMEEVTKDQRKKAKAVNFGFIYGMGSRKFKDYARDSYDVYLTDTEADQFRTRFFDLYNMLPAWHDRQRRIARRQKAVRTPLGRLRRLPEIDSPDRYLAGEAERQAINSPVQSCASDLTLFSLVRITNEFDREDVQVVGTVHDAILIMVRDEVLDEVLPRINEIMIGTDEVEATFKTHINVPLEIEMKVGPWGTGKVVEFGSH